MVLNNYRNFSCGKVNMTGFVTTTISGLAQNHSYSDGGALTVNAKFLVGTGTTPVTATDYALANEVQLKQITATSGSLSYDSVNKLNKETFSCIYENNTGATVSISEYGLMSTPISALLTREVLENPIILEDGDTITLTAVLA